MEKNYYNIIETLVCICRAYEGKLQILLKRKKTDPYRGCFILPGTILPNNETLNTSVKSVVYDNTGIIINKMFQNNVFSDLKRDPSARIIACVYTVILNDENINLNSDYELLWNSFDDIQTMGYDHEKIINDIYPSLKRKIINNDDNILKDFFPDKFTLNELQVFYENVAGGKCDRRNFRKRLIMQELVEETGEENKQITGRPSKFYKFTDKIANNSLK